jgi:membrane protein implicated in regulation of membrane protease activity
MEWLGKRHRRLLLLVAAAAALEGLLAGLAVASLALGARLWAAGFALATLVAAPLLLVGPGLDRWRHRAPRRRVHHRRPEEFPPG